MKKKKPLTNTSTLQFNKDLNTIDDNSNGSLNALSFSNGMTELSAEIFIDSTLIVFATLKEGDQMIFYIPSYVNEKKFKVNMFTKSLQKGEAVIHLKGHTITTAQITTTTTTTQLTTTTTTTTTSTDLPDLGKLNH